MVSLLKLSTQTPALNCRTRVFRSIFKLRGLEGTRGMRGMRGMRGITSNH